LTDVLTFSENPQLAGELATAADSIAAGAGGRVFAVEVDAVREAPAHGSVLLVKAARPISGDSELIASAISEAARRRASPIVLIGSTKLGRMVAGRLAVASRMCVLADVRDLKVDGVRLTGVRGVYAGKFNAKVEGPLPCVALVPQGAYEATAGSPGPVEEITVEGFSPRVKRTEARAPQRSALDLRTAKIIVAAGRGFKTKEDLALVEKLAKALGGAMGASRPLSSDLGWLGEEYHIGLTGVYVRPNLYLAIGISGQLQHVAGIKDSKVIAAINKDKQAPIFQVADYGIVGDLYQVVPALLKILGSE
jgi:electron transfer flavoprotein alpha subunit